MAEGRSWIVFLRKAEEPGVPYYTLEIGMQDGKLRQWYSEYDRQPDTDKIKPFLDKYMARVRKRMAIAATEAV